MTKWFAAKFMLRVLTEEQNNKCVNVYSDLQEQLKNDPQVLTIVVR